MRTYQIHFSFSIESSAGVSAAGKSRLSSQTYPTFENFAVVGIESSSRSPETYTSKRFLRNFTWNPSVQRTGLHHRLDGAVAILGRSKLNFSPYGTVLSCRAWLKSLTQPNVCLCIFGLNGTVNVIFNYFNSTNAKDDECNFYNLSNSTFVDRLRNFNCPV